MKKLIIACLVLMVLLTACGGISRWTLSPDVDGCSNATVLEKDWYGGDRTEGFYLLLETTSGEIGYAKSSAYEYVTLEVGDTVCVVTN